MLKKINLRHVVLGSIILLAALSRLVIHVDNFTPLGAMCLFGGAYYSKNSLSFIVPLLSLFISDVIIQGIVYQGQYGFPLYEGWYWVYGTFALLVVVGQYLLKKVNVVNIVLASSSAAFIHWLITDFGVWISGCNVKVYTMNIKGFILCYTMAIPYMASFFMGTLFYSVLFFGVFEWAKNHYPRLAQYSHHD